MAKQYTPSAKNNQGFTLVELSIVIVIIGLIIAGVTAGNSLVNSAKMRSTIGDLRKYQTAIMTFKGQYNYWPGDLPNAFAYWGTALSCTNAIALYNTSGCNGNGDGKVHISIAAGNLAEGNRSWQHLSHIGLIENRYSGGIGTGWDCKPGVVTPKAQVSKDAYTAIAYTREPYNNQGQITNFLAISRTSSGVGNCWEPALNALTTYTIDSKIDDGLPNTGQLIMGITSTCNSGNAYDLTNQNSNNCSAIYKF